MVYPPPVGDRSLFLHELGNSHLAPIKIDVILLLSKKLKPSI
ncbi:MULTISPECIES: hypothetical protein [Calothrix]|nr:MULTISPECIES: hypothetical protein [Calothrix]